MRFEEIENKDMTVVSVSVPGTDAATATNYGKFFIARRPYEVMEVAEVHGAAGTGGAATLDLERLQGTEALGSGDGICVAEFDLEGTADTVVTKKGVDLQNRTLEIGDRLALKDTGTLTSVADVCVTVLLKPLGKGDYR